MTDDRTSHTAPERVLATLNADGSRRWLSPRLSKGRFLHARRIVAYALIVIFTAIPYITINGRPAMLLDIAHRRFTFFGHTFLATDTVLLALLMLIIFLTIFLATALFGRVWCGWACPQTVYMEFLYRPLDRLFDGAPGSARAKRPTNPVLRVLKYVIFFIFSCFLAHIFLAYFVGVDVLLHWVKGSPFKHPASFLIMAATTALMMFDFAFFREQTCLVACPYGRIQSAMLDRHTLIVSYDAKRGEPRGKVKKHAGEDLSLRVLSEAPSTPLNGHQPAQSRTADCVDCGMCVTTCPTGIDIREGLQMECIGCAQCIDACDAVMDKLHRPRGLIGYSSRAILERQAKSIVRPRIILYPLLLLGLISLFSYKLVTRSTGEAAILPRQGAPFYTLPNGDIANQVRLRLVNRGEESAEFNISVDHEYAEHGVRLKIEGAPFTLQPAESITVGCVLEAPQSAFSHRGALDADITITDARKFHKTLSFHMLGPVNHGTPRDSEHDEHEPSGEQHEDHHADGDKR